MGRLIKGWTPDKVADAEVAPHRYMWDSDSPEDDAPDWRAFLAAVPYKAGEVVWVQRAGHGCYVAKRARIVSVWFERDRWGDRRAVFRVQFETQAGLWSKVWERTYPGPIQRGYKLAGLAPEMPEDT